MTKKTQSQIMTKKKCHTKRRFVTHTLHLITTYVRTIATVRDFQTITEAQDD